MTDPNPAPPFVASAERYCRREYLVAGLWGVLPGLPSILFFRPGSAPEWIAYALAAVLLVAGLWGIGLWLFSLLSGRVRSRGIAADAATGRLTCTNLRTLPLFLHPAKDEVLSFELSAIRVVIPRRDWRGVPYGTDIRTPAGWVFVPVEIVSPEALAAALGTHTEEQVRRLLREDPQVWLTVTFAIVLCAAAALLSISASLLR